MQTEITELEFQGVPMTVEYTYHPGTHGARDRFGVPLEPDEPATIEISDVRVADVDVWTLIEDDVEKIEDLIMQQKESEYDEH